MNWYAIYCRSQHEETVRDGLGQFAEAFLPTEKVTRRWSDRSKTIDKPLFPGYVFGRFERDQAGTVAGIRGVVAILGGGYTPTPIPDEEIESLRQLLASGLIMQAVPFRNFQVGQKVTVEYGPFVARTGVIERIKKGGYRLIVAISAIEAARAVELSVELDAGSLRPAQKAA